MQDAITKVRLFLMNMGADRDKAKFGVHDGHGMLQSLMQNPSENKLALIIVMIERGVWADGSELLDHRDSCWTDQMTQSVLGKNENLRNLVEAYRDFGHIEQGLVL